MAEQRLGNAAPDSAQVTPPMQPAKPRPQNPVFRAMGLPNFRFRLPSRNWLIFLSITGSIAAVITYDRRQKKVNQRKWCDLVAHIAQDPLPVKELPRKLTIFLAAPPGDSIRPSREYFKQYIKPVLVAAAMDYDVIEGRKEGEVRYGTAEQIRRLRRKRKEKGENDATQEPDTEMLLDALRELAGTRREAGLSGDLVIGRHTWKEYIRGLHEGWLGPLESPSLPVAAPLEEATPELSPIHPPVDIPSSTPTSDNASPSTQTDTGAEKPSEEAKAPEAAKPPSTPSAYLSTAQYSTSPLSPTIPVMLEPSAPIPQRHLLGFLKTPQRIYDFLTQRYLADSIGRQTAAVVLAAHRPYHHSSAFASTSSSTLDLDNNSPSVATRAPEGDSTAVSDPAAAVVQTNGEWEQQSVLANEEAKWHKSARKPRTDGLERVWLDDVVMDSRIAERMRRFELSAQEEERAKRIGEGIEKTRALEIQDLRKVKPKVEDLSHLD